MPREYLRDRGTSESESVTVSDVISGVTRIVALLPEEVLGRTPSLRKHKTKLKDRALRHDHPPAQPVRMVRMVLFPAHLDPLAAHRVRSNRSILDLTTTLGQTPCHGEPSRFRERLPRPKIPISRKARCSPLYGRLGLYSRISTVDREIPGISETRGIQEEIDGRPLGISLGIGTGETTGASHREDKEGPQVRLRSQGRKRGSRVRARATDTSKVTVTVPMRAGAQEEEGRVYLDWYPALYPTRKIGQRHPLYQLQKTDDRPLHLGLPLRISRSKASLEPRCPLRNTPDHQGRRPLRCLSPQRISWAGSRQPLKKRAQVRRGWRGADL